MSTAGFDESGEQRLPPAAAPELTRQTLVGPGTVLDGRYRLDQLLGEGGMGSVYAATHLHLRRRVAVKVLKPEVANNPSVFERFRYEAQSASAIGHPNIVDIRDFGLLADKTSFIVMEHLDGRDLHDLIEAYGPVPPKLAHQIALQVAMGLSAAHAAGIIHRDLKPDNIFLVDAQANLPTNAEPVVKILDFGIAKVVDGTQRLTKSGQIFGTPQYMSPEQCAGREVDARSDVYALGAVLYEMLAGVPPFQADTLVAVLTKQLYEKPRPLSTLCLPFPIDEGFEVLVMRCLEKRPSRRFASMEEAMAALRALALSSHPPLPFSPQDADSWRPEASSVAPGPLMPSSAPPADSDARPDPSIPQDFEIATAATLELSVPPRASRARRVLAVVALLFGAAALAWWMRPASESPSATASAPPDSRATPAAQKTQRIRLERPQASELTPPVGATLRETAPQPATTRRTAKPRRRVKARPKAKQPTVTEAVGGETKTPAKPATRPEGLRVVDPWAK